MDSLLKLLLLVRGWDVLRFFLFFGGFGYLLLLFFGFLNSWNFFLKIFKKFHFRFLLQVDNHFYYTNFQESLKCQETLRKNLILLAKLVEPYCGAQIIQVSWIIFCQNFSDWIFFSEIFKKSFQKIFQNFFSPNQSKKIFLKGDRAVYNSPTTTSTNTCINSTTIFYK